MAKALFLCSRNRLTPQTFAKVSGILELLTPPWLSATPPLVQAFDDGVLVGATYPGLIEARPGSLLLGRLNAPPPAWDAPGGPAPDGSFALFRSDAATAEVLTDPAGSRTLWTYFDDEIFLASTSQVAILRILGSFAFDERVIPWMLSTGGIGPDLSWDRRLSIVPPDTTVRLDRRAWTLHTSSRPLVFAPHPGRRHDHEDRLRQTLLHAFEPLPRDLKGWGLSLSGGYDSRSVLSLLHHLGRDLRDLQTVSWGTRASLKDPTSDAVVAARVAHHYGTSHHFFPLHDDHLDAETLLDRFLFCGEGRVDHLAGYLDGFRLFQSLRDQGLHGLLRGDEGFGLKVRANHSPLAVRLSVRLGLCSDFANLADLHRLGLPPQELPQTLHPAPQESLSTYRDRLFHQYKLPVIVAALGDLKAPFIDQVNPLLSRPILKAMRSLPDHLRDQKRLFCRVVTSLSPDIPVAQRSASLRTCEAVRRPDLLALITAELHSQTARSLFPRQLLAAITADLSHHAERPTLFRLGSRHLPRRLKTLLSLRGVQHRADSVLIAFRLALLSRMHRTLTAASAAGHHTSARAWASANSAATRALS